MPTFSIKESFTRVVTQAAIITSEVNHSLDWYESKIGKVSTPEQMLELGALLAGVRRGRAMADDLVGTMPSPNQVPAHLAQSVVDVTMALFRFIESCDQREATINAIALGYKHKSAV